MKDTLFTYQTPIEVADRDNGISILVGNEETFIKDPSVPTFHDTDVTADGYKELQSRMWELIKNNIDKTMTELCANVIANHPFDNNYRLEITFKEISQ
jgi:hypothetical protein